MSALLQRADELTATARQRVPGADAGFQAFQREVAFGGGLLAGGLAYRLFLWLLPIGLVGAQVLGIWLDANEDGVEDAAKEFGIGAAAIASAGGAVETSQSNRILLVLTGLVLLAWFSLGFVRALQLAYSLAWGLPRPKARKPLYAVLLFNGLFLDRGRRRRRARLAPRGARPPRRARRPRDDRLPDGGRAARHVAASAAGRALAGARPGAVLVAVGAQLVSVAVVFYFAPRIGRSTELYGTLGTAAVLLVWLYVVARLITSGAFLNATLWERR